MPKLPKFEVDAAGFAALQQGREPWTLAKEAISNSFDESPVTKVKVSLTKRGNAPALFVVEDDGEGFANLRDAWTMYADVPKRSNPRQRGRFDRGEKELLSVAIRGSVITTSGSVYFDKDARRMGRKRTAHGTIVTVEVKWTKDEVEEILGRLRSFLPPLGKQYIVNGVEVPHREPSYVVEAYLLTPLKDPETGAFRNVSRNTEVFVYRPKEDETPSLMELGIPVVPLVEFDVPFILDVQQKVPMAPERSSVRPSYLQDMFAEVLNAVAKGLTEAESNGKWVNIALADPRVLPETVWQVKETRIGKSLMMDPNDPVANERAVNAGYKLISTKGWDLAVISAFKYRADWKTTSEVFPGPPQDEGTPVSTPGIERTRRFILAMAKAMGMPRQPTVRFVNQPRAWADADCRGRSITFYVNRTGTRVFDTLSSELLALVTHEFAHIGPAGTSPYTAHDQVWGERGFKTLAFILFHPELLAHLQEEK